MKEVFLQALHERSSLSVYFTAVFVLSATGNDLFFSFVGGVGTKREISIFALFMFKPFIPISFQDVPFASQTAWGNRRQTRSCFQITWSLSLLKLDKAMREATATSTNETNLHIFLAKLITSARSACPYNFGSSLRCSL